MQKIECFRSIKDNKPDQMRQVLACNDSRGSCYRWYRANEKSQWGWEWLAYQGWLECAAPVTWLDHHKGINMSWKYPERQELPDIGVEVVAIPCEGDVTLAKRNEGYWWTDVLGGEDMNPPKAWIEKPNITEQS